MPTTFYIFHGDDDLRIEEEVQKIRDKMGHTPDAEMNIAEFDGATDVNEILNAANSYPFLADKRLVIVKDMLTWITRKGAGNAGKKAVELLLDALPKLPEWTRLVFVESQKLADSNKVLQLARQAGGNGLEKAYSAPKDSTGWIVKRAQEEYGTKIDLQAAAALSSVTGSDLRRADNELVKLISYVDGARPITEADVALLTPYVAEASMFEMVDALAEGRGKAAALLIRRLLEQDEDIFSLYGMIVRQFRLLLLAKEHLATGGVPGSIAKDIGVHPYVAEKLAKQTRSFTLPQLEQIYRRLQEYDLQIKTGRIEPILALDLLIAGLSTR
jgi:DNA polymerase III subunit delta